MERSKVIMEWENRGRLKSLRETLLRVLQVRFTQSPPDDLAQAIQQQDNADTLSHWFDLALTAASLEQMRSLLQNGNGNGTRPG